MPDARLRRTREIYKMTDAQTRILEAWKPNARTCEDGEYHEFRYNIQHDAMICRRCGDTRKY